ncbi:adenylate/guanylate cyclase domain-containing protein, partial [Rhizobiaceae sp. 2RAB30]
LPFTSYGGDEATIRLASGLTEDIITDLARFPEFQVIASNSTDQYRDKPTSPSEVGMTLNAAFVVEGSIQREADQVRVTAQLVDTGTGKHLWSQRWDRPAKDLFAIQTEISEQLSNRLGGGAGLIQEAGRVSAHRRPPENLGAYELYLLGTERLERVTQADAEEALRLLNRAVELDPGLARAWVELHH